MLRSKGKIAAVLVAVLAIALAAGWYCLSPVWTLRGILSYNPLRDSSHREPIQPGFAGLPRGGPSPSGSVGIAPLSGRNPLRLYGILRIAFRPKLAFATVAAFHAFLPLGRVSDWS